MEPFKNAFNPSLIAAMANHFAKHGVNFNAQSFIADATHNLEQLELKQRSAQITASLKRHLPSDFEKAAAILLASLDQNPANELKHAQITSQGIAGWAIMPMADYVGQHGLAHFESSMHLLAELTKRFTAEFAIRPFLQQNQAQTMAQMCKWAEDENRHVRRLASEGCRPRLPWATQLPQLITDPTPLLPLLGMLKDDPAPCVRKSVANNLNDIAKDHPQVVTSVAKTWLVGAPTERRRLIKHACRSLIKQGCTETLTVLGYTKPQLKINTFKLHTPNVHFGESLPFTLSLTSTNTQKQPLIVDYIIHHKKAGGHTTPKVFKWKTFELAAGSTVVLTKKHPFKKISTRVYYSGTHTFELMINGKSMLKHNFELIL